MILGEMMINFGVNVVHETASAQAPQDVQQCEMTQNFDFSGRNVICFDRKTG